MVGLQTLDLAIGVRVPASQPLFKLFNFSTLSSVNATDRSCDCCELFEQRTSRFDRTTGSVYLRDEQWSIRPL
jgi:hypothetical protein